MSPIVKVGLTLSLASLLLAGWFWFWNKVNDDPRPAGGIMGWVAVATVITFAGGALIDVGALLVWIWSY